ncbi:MAG: ACP S-malonyltransferase [Alphaproteobacteria bacterium]
MPRALVFPGQGSQFVGMGRELAEAFPVARELFEEVDAALGQPLRRLMLDGPEGDLTLTENAQPALMAVSMAVVRVLEEQGKANVADIAKFVAGHSLGEYTALAAGGALGVTEVAKLLRTRGRAMQDAVPVGEGAMAALIGLDLDVAEAVAEESRGAEVCSVANDNSPGQVVVSGHRHAVERAVSLAGERGARKTVMLPVSAPFHCALMEPAAEVMSEALAAIDFARPAVPVVANVTAEPVSDPERIRELLVRQVTARVRWRECVLAIRDRGVDTFAEVGAGKVLSGLARRIDRGLTATSVGGPAEIEAFLEQL